MVEIAPCAELIRKERLSLRNLLVRAGASSFGMDDILVGLDGDILVCWADFVGQQIVEDSKLKSVKQRVNLSRDSCLCWSRWMCLPFHGTNNHVQICF